MHAKELIYSDLNRLAEPTFYNLIKWYFLPKGSTFPYQVWLRLWMAVKKSKVLKLLVGPYVYFRFNHFGFKYGINVNTNMNIGPGMCIIHGFGVFLNCCAIGSNFTCAQNVTFGVNSGGGMRPIVGDNVTIYVGAIVVGDVSIGNNSVIGANSYVNGNIEENVIVAGSPAKVIKKRQA